MLCSLSMKFINTFNSSLRNTTSFNQLLLLLSTLVLCLFIKVTIKTNCKLITPFNSSHIQQETAILSVVKLYQRRLKTLYREQASRITQPSSEQAKCLM